MLTRRGSRHIRHRSSAPTIGGAHDSMQSQTSGDQRNKGCSSGFGGRRSRQTGRHDTEAGYAVRPDIANEIRFLEFWVTLMRVGSLIRNVGSGYDRLAVIMVLIAYVLVGGISGFGLRGSSHAQLETVHLPNVSRDRGADALRSEQRDLGDDGSTQFLQQFLDQSAGSAPPLSTKNAFATANDFARIVGVFLNLFIGDAGHAPPFETQTGATTNPERWLRTVVLHL